MDKPREGFEPRVQFLVFLPRSRQLRFPVAKHFNAPNYTLTYMSGLWDAIIAAINRADKPALVLIIAGGLIGFFLWLYKPSDPTIQILILLSGICFIMGLTLLILNHYFEKDKQSPVKRKPRKPKKAQQVVPVSKERPFREKVKDAREVVKLIKDINDLEDS